MRRRAPWAQTLEKGPPSYVADLIAITFVAARRVQLFFM